MTHPTFDPESVDLRYELNALEENERKLDYRDRFEPAGERAFSLPAHAPRLAQKSK